MKDCKAYCTCPRCSDARDFERAGKPKRFLPKFVKEQIAEKHFKDQEMMLWKGYILNQCPACRHKTYMKIEPIMTCPACCHKIT